MALYLPGVAACLYSYHSLSHFCLLIGTAITWQNHNDTSLPPDLDVFPGFYASSFHIHVKKEGPTVCWVLAVCEALWSLGYIFTFKLRNNTDKILLLSDIFFFLVFLFYN